MNSRDRNPVQFVARNLLHGALRLARFRGEPGSRLSSDFQAFEVFEWKHDGRLGSMARTGFTRGGSGMRRTIRADVVLDDAAICAEGADSILCFHTTRSVRHAIR
jgi:hypothetical protein